MHSTLHADAFLSHLLRQLNSYVNSSFRAAHLCLTCKHRTFPAYLANARIGYDSHAARSVVLERVLLVSSQTFARPACDRLILVRICCVCFHHRYPDPIASRSMHFIVQVCAHAIASVLTSPHTPRHATAAWRRKCAASRNDKHVSYCTRCH